MRVRFFLLFALGSVMAGTRTPARAQAAPVEAGAPLVRWWDPEDFHAHQQVWQGAQAPDGVMWFGNARSVLRFDGARWLRILVPTSFVRALAVDDAGRVWVGGTDELGVIEPDADGLPAYRSLRDALPPADREPGVVWSVVRWRGAVWFATESRVLRWDGAAWQGWRMENFKRQLLQVVGDALILHRQGVGLFRFDSATADFVRVADVPRWKSTAVCRVVAQPDGTWLILLADGLLWRWDGAKLTPWPTAIDGWLAAHPPRYVTELADGGLALGGRGGVVWIGPDGAFRGRADQSTGLGNDTVFSLTTDREGGLWVGSDHGVGRLAIGGGVTRFDERQGLPRSLATSLVRHQGALHVAYSEGVFRLIPADPTTASPARWERIDRKSGTPWALVSRTDGLLVGALDGVWWWPDEGDAVQVAAVSSGVGVLQTSVRDPDRVWVGGFLGLRSLRWTGDAWVVEGAVAGLETEVRTLAELDDGTLWVGTPTRGFLRVSPGGNVQTFGTEAGLRADHGWCHVYRDGAGVPLFVTDSGTYRFAPAAERFALADEMRIAGRSDRTQLWPLVVAGDGGMWTQADTDDQEVPRLIGRLEPARAEPARWRALPRQVGEAGGYGGMRAMRWEAETHTLWLVGSAALIAVAVDAVPAPVPVSALIARATLPDGRTVGGGVAGWSHAYARAPLKVEVAAPCFGAGPGLAYRWRVSGYDEQWSPWSAEPQATFTNLQGGSYAFEVQARDPDGREGPVTRRALTVTPPWWRSRPVLAAYAGLGLLLGWLLIRWRVAAVERRAARLESLVEVRTTELVEARDEAEAASRAKSEFVAGISHELRHPLQSILGQAELVQRDPAATTKLRERGAVIDASGRRLLRLIEDVLDVARLDAQRLSLRVAPCDLERLVTRVETAHAPRAATRGLQWRVEREAGVRLPTVELDGERLGQILDNLVSNALKFTATGWVTLTVRRAADGLAFEVADSGPGIAADEQERIFTAFEQGAAGRGSAGGIGLGLAISRSLATMMGGSLTVTSSLGQGSRFTLWLPIRWVAENTGPSLGWSEASESLARLLETLRAAAACGDLGALRTALGQLRGVPEAADLVVDLEALANRFELAGIRQRLRQSR